MFIGLSVFLSLHAGSFAYSIRVDNKHLNLTNRSAQAAGTGFDCVSAYESAENDSKLTVSGFLDDEKWEVSARASAPALRRGDVVLYLRRTSGGSGSGNVTGGTGWTRIESSNTRFFSGSGNLKDISVQMRAEGNETNLTPGVLNITVDYLLSVSGGGAR